MFWVESLDPQAKAVEANIELAVEEAVEAELDVGVEDKIADRMENRIDRILDDIENKLDIKVGESTPDGRIFLKPEEECLAACSAGPMMQVDHVYHEKLTPEKIDEILDGLE